MTSTACITPLVVRVLLAQRRLALVVSLTIAMHCSDVEVSSAWSTSRCGRRLLSHQAVPSSVVFRMRMSRNSADGQPWLTAATWPGWALPQLNAPPSS